MEKIKKYYRETIPELTLRQAFICCSIGKSSKHVVGTNKMDTLIRWLPNFGSRAVAAPEISEHLHPCLFLFMVSRLDSRVARVHTKDWDGVSNWYFEMALWLGGALGLDIWLAESVILSPSAWKSSWRPWMSIRQYCQFGSSTAGSVFGLWKKDSSSVYFILQVILVWSSVLQYQSQYPENFISITIAIIYMEMRMASTVEKKITSIQNTP